MALRSRHNPFSGVKKRPSVKRPSQEGSIDATKDGFHEVPMSSQEGSVDATSDGFHAVPPIRELPDMVAPMQDLIDNTFVYAGTCDRKGELPTGFQVIQVQQLESMPSLDRYSNYRAFVEQRNYFGQPILLQNILKDDVLTKQHTHAMNLQLMDACNEIYLWYGCAPNEALDILQHGFDLSSGSSRASTMLGRAVLLAESPTRSDEYTDDDYSLSNPNDHHWLLLCRVVLGLPLQLTLKPENPKCLTEMMTPGDPNFMALGPYLSAMYTGTFREFAMYNADGVYPEFLVMYRRCFEEEPQCTPAYSRDPDKCMKEITEEGFDFTDMESY